MLLEILSSVFVNLLDYTQHAMMQGFIRGYPKLQLDLKLNDLFDSDTHVLGKNTKTRRQSINNERNACVLAFRVVCSPFVWNAAPGQT